jgi:hypothetical protein
MKFVAIARTPAHPDEAAGALAGAAGLALAEARMRLAPEPPALLARLGPEDADALVFTLRRARLAVLAVPVGVPTDRDRTRVHAFSLDDAGFGFTARSGDALRGRWPDVLAVLRGRRASRSEVERTEKSRTFSLGVAAATGGLKLTRTSTKTARSSTESMEQVILVYARDGRAAVLSERDLDFSCLGRDMHPSSAANMAELALRLRERAAGAFYDERLLRLGRRLLPFLGSGESYVRTATTTATHTDTSGSLDVLAEVMRRAVLEGLLP